MKQSKLKFPNYHQLPVGGGGRLVDTSGLKLFVVRESDIAIVSNLQRNQ